MRPRQSACGGGLKPPPGIPNLLAQVTIRVPVLYQPPVSNRRRNKRPAA